MHSRILKLTAAAFCFGILTSASVASAAPVGGMAIRDGAAAVGLIDQVQDLTSPQGSPPQGGCVCVHER